MRTGFIGLGTQGAPMARRIAEAGIPVTVWARRPEVAVNAIEWGADVAESPAALGAGCDVVGVCVFDAAGVEEVLFGRDGVVASSAPGTIILVHSTVSPADVRSFATRAGARGVTVLDAPVSGGPGAAASGELLVLLGGPAEAADRVRSVVEAYAGRVVHFPDVGSAQLAKLINNALLAAQVALVADAVRLGQDHQLADELIDTLRAGSARGFAVDLFASVRSLDQLARTQFTPTMGKDVRLLREVVGQSCSLLDIAAGLTAELGAKVSGNLPAER